MQFGKERHKRSAAKPKFAVESTQTVGAKYKLPWGIIKGGW